MFRFERVINITSPPFTQLDDYQHLVQEFRGLVERRAAILMLFSSAQAVNWLPPHESDSYEGAPLDVSTLKQGPALAASPYRDSLPMEAPAAGPPASGANAAMDGKHRKDIPSAYARNAPSACDLRPVLKPSPRKIAVAAEATFEDLNAYVQGIDCFVSYLRVSVDNYNYPLSVAIYQTRLKVHLLTTWLLPSLYGLLGACVFLLRDIVFIRQGPQSRYQPRMINLLSLLLRIALGGLAGIIIGWFSVPGSFAARDAQIAITSIPFGLAFLAGFSIETLFTLLDKFNKAIADPLHRHDSADGPESHGGEVPTAVEKSEPPMSRA